MATYIEEEDVSLGVMTYTDMGAQVVVYVGRQCSCVSVVLF